MKLNWVEKMIVKSPVRGLVQHHVEGKKLLRMGGAAYGDILEIGCGHGIGVDVIQRVFNGQSIDAVDLDEDMVSLAQKRHASNPQVRVMQADICKIKEQDKRYDCIFNFAVLHHVPNWQMAVENMYAILNPSGKFYIEEFYKRLICNPIINKIVEHPQENRFDHQMLIDQLEHVGFEVTAHTNLFNCIGLVVAQKK